MTLTSRKSYLYQTEDLLLYHLWRVILWSCDLDLPGNLTCIKLRTFSCTTCGGSYLGPMTLTSRKSYLYQTEGLLLYHLWWVILGTYDLDLQEILPVSNWGHFPVSPVVGHTWELWLWTPGNLTCIKLRTFSCTTCGGSYFGPMTLNSRKSYLYQTEDLLYHLWWVILWSYDFELQEILPVSNWRPPVPPVVGHTLVLWPWPPRKSYLYQTEDLLLYHLWWVILWSYDLELQEILPVSNWGPSPVPPVVGHTLVLWPWTPGNLTCIKLRTFSCTTCGGSYFGPMTLIISPKKSLLATCTWNRRPQFLTQDSRHWNSKPLILNIP